ncbi:MAG: response regulator transcription factor [Lachnospiraceae bacterium]|nr:response regulator transcription factor [Lachnospiraceae bacterium]
MPNILICDDEKDIVNALKIYLSDPDYTLYEAYNGQEALKVLQNNDIQLVLMDIMMPVMDGITAMAKIREFSNVPIIVLTAKSEDTDKILGLNVGADDYITKPFNPLEVTARVRSQLRRFLKLGGGTEVSGTLSIRGLEINDRSKEVFLDGEPVNLTPKEYDILKLLMTNTDRVFSPKEIYSTVWKEKPFGSDNTVAVHIRHLREKIEIDPADPRYIKVVFGQGYKIEGERKK